MQVSGWIRDFLAILHIKTPVFYLGKIMNAHKRQTGAGLSYYLAQCLNAVQKPLIPAAFYLHALF